MSPRHVQWTCVALVVCFAAAASAGAQPISSQVLPIGPSQWIGPPLPLTTTSFLAWAEPYAGCPAQGGEGAELLLVEDLDGTPRVTSLAVPLARDIRWWTRMSATRVLLLQKGEDQIDGTADDGFYLLDDLGGSNRITAFAVAPLGGPYRLDDDTAAFSAEGQLLILSDLGGRNSVTPVPGAGELVLVLSSRSLLVGNPGSDGLYFLSLDDPELRPVALPPVPFCCRSLLRLSPTSVMGVSRLDPNGPQDDDVVYLLRDLGGTNQRTVLPAPYSGAALTPLSADRVLLQSSGTTFRYGDTDDQVLLFDHLDDLDADPTVTAIPVPRIKEAIGPVVLGPQLAVVVTSGSDAGGEARSGPEDGVAVLSGLGTLNDVTQVVLGPLSTGYSYEAHHLSHPMRLGPRSLVLGGLGADATWATADDEVVSLTDVGGANQVERSVVGDLWSGPVVAFPPAGALALVEGADALSGTSDDRVVFVSGIGTAHEVQSLEIGYPSPSEGSGWRIPFDDEWEVLGNGRALVDVSEGYVEDYGYCESRLQLVSGLSGGIRLAAEEIQLRREPGKPARLRATAELVLPNPELFASSDLTIRVGNASQTIPAEHITRNASGFHYLDVRGYYGWLRRVEYDAVAGRIEVSGRGSGIGAGSTRARNLILSLESRDFQIAQTLDGKARPNGIRYRRP
jgi:hypothetical protein